MQSPDGGMIGTVARDECLKVSSTLGSFRREEGEETGRREVDLTDASLHSSLRFVPVLEDLGSSASCEAETVADGGR